MQGIMKDPNLEFLKLKIESLRIRSIRFHIQFVQNYNPCMSEIEFNSFRLKYLNLMKNVTQLFNFRISQISSIMINLLIC